MIGNRRIIECVATKENLGKLEEIIKQDLNEYRQTEKNYPKDYSRKIRKKERAREILKQGKHFVDEFLMLNPDENIPKIEICKSLDLKAAGLYSSIVSNGIMLGGGITLAAYFNQPMIGGVMAGIGLLKLATFAAIKLKIQTPHYEKGKIFCTKAREKKMLFDIMHEYSHMVSENSLDRGMNTWLLYEGFAEGVSIHIARNNPAFAGSPVKKRALFRGIEMMDNARHGIKKRLEGKDIFEDAVSQGEAGQIKIVENTAFAMLGCGYSIFRLAEEQSGPIVYKEVLDGNYSALLC
ncbi:MAG: hypothetical protein PHO02_04035 [Candidatus Nanoarchaeia archaeon]|nr:hypothetical protein [Candidatus Nanoarchaeia archaeon]